MLKVAAKEEVEQVNESHRKQNHGHFRIRQRPAGNPTAYPVQFMILNEVIQPPQQGDAGQASTDPSTSGS
jgi:hypothetical protein